jgi:hypothetical protein
MERIEIGKEIVTMRSWSDSEQCIRAMLLSTYAMDIFPTPVAFKQWLVFQRPSLDGRSLFNLVQQGEWRVFADYLDDSLTGSPS